jgi:hypothetical protein
MAIGRERRNQRTVPTLRKVGNCLEDVLNNQELMIGGANGPGL